jgi:AraC family transcriptional regulator
MDDIALALGTPGDVTLALARDGTRLSRRWRREALHAWIPTTSRHIVGAYYADVRDVLWRSGGTRMAGKARTGTMTLIPGGCQGRLDVVGAIDVSHVFLTHERLQSIADPLTGGKTLELVGRVAFDDPAACRILELLAREAEVGDASSRLFVEQALDLLCTQLIRGHSSFANLPQSTPRTGLAAWQVRRATQFMLENLGEDIGLDEIAAVAGLSRHHFCTSFRLAVGKTPYEWLTAERIKQAQQLLRDSQLSISEIALSVGYSTPSAFAASFRRAMRMTPSEFRRRL